MFASAVGVALPGDCAFPPMSTISLIFESIPGCSFSKLAILVNGPTGTKVIS